MVTYCRSTWLVPDIRMISIRASTGVWDADRASEATRLSIFPDWDWKMSDNAYRINLLIEYSWLVDQTCVKAYKSNFVLLNTNSCIRQNVTRITPWYHFISLMSWYLPWARIAIYQEISQKNLCYCIMYVLFVGAIQEKEHAAVLKTKFNRLSCLIAMWRLKPSRSFR